MKTTVHIIWGKLAVSLYKSGRIDASVKLAHAAYDFFSHEAANGFRLGVAAARESADWLEVTRMQDIRALGAPLRQRLIDAANRGDLDTVIALLEMGVDPNGPDSRGLCALHYACMRADLAIASALLRAGADPDKKQEGESDSTPLHFASSVHGLDGEELTAMLLEHGASATTCDIHGNRPLHFAAKSGSLGSAQILLQHGARALDENNFGEAPRNLVKNHTALLQLLEDAENRETIASAARRKHPSPHPTPENSTER